jgi:hypothetical protein
MAFRIARALPAPAALALLALIAAPTLADHASRHYDVSGKPSLSIDARDGTVRVHPGAPGQIDIDVDTHGWKIGNGGLKIVADQEGNRVRFEVQEPHRFLVFDLRINRRVVIDVRVPPELDLDVTTSDGGVAIADLAGNIRLHTGDGNVEAQRLKGDLSIESGDGHVSVDAHDGRLRARSGDGRLSARGRFDRLDIGTSDGAVEVEAVPRSRVVDEWRITTGDGPVTVRLPRDLAADLDVHTGDGRITTDLTVAVTGTVTSQTLHGRLNGGGERITVHTGDGSIRVEGS